METDAAATPVTAPAYPAPDLESIVSGLMETPPVGDETPDDKPNEPASGDAEQAPDTVDEAETADASDEQEPGEQQDDGPTYKVKVNGEEREVPLTELLNGYSRTEDYKQKTAALAEQRRSLEATVQQQYAEQMEAATAAFIALDPVLAEAQQIDWAALLNDDPGAHYTKQQQVRERLDAIEYAQQQAQAAKQRAFAAEVERERNALAQALPDVGGDLDPWLAGVSEYVAKQGVPDTVLASLTHHKLYVIADKARKYDEMQAAKANLPTKVQTPKPTAKPLKPSGEQAPRSTLRKPGPNAGTDAHLAFILGKIGQDAA